MLLSALCCYQGAYAASLSTVVLDFEKPSDQGGGIVHDVQKYSHVSSFFFTLNSARLSESPTSTIGHEVFQNNMDLISLSFQWGRSQDQANGFSSCYYALLDDQNQLVDYSGKQLHYEAGGYAELTFSQSLTIDPNKTYNVVFIHDKKVKAFETALANGSMVWSLKDYGFSNGQVDYTYSDYWDNAPSLECVEFRNTYHGDIPGYENNNGNILVDDKLLGVNLPGNNVATDNNLRGPKLEFVVKEHSSQSIPEPSSALLGAFGIMSFLLRRKR